MNNDNRIRNRMLDIYSDLARYTHLNQIQTNDTLQQIESGIRELNRQYAPANNVNNINNTNNTSHYPPFNTRNRNNNNDPGTNTNTNTNTWTERIYRNSNDIFEPTIRNMFPYTTYMNPRTIPSTIHSTNPRTNTTNIRTPNNTRRASPNNTRSSTTGINQLSNTDFLNQFFNMFNTDLNNLTPVTVRPTQVQIANAVEIISINENMVNTICPILQTSFQDGDRISRIKHCGHCFIEEGLMSWFNQSVICPVCRYDIRDYPIEPTPVVPVDPIQRVDPVDPVDPATSINNTRDLSNNITNSTNTRTTNTTTNEHDLMDILTNEISNTFQRYLTGYDSSFNNLNNSSISVDYFVQTPTTIYTTSTPSRAFTINDAQLRFSERVEEEGEREVGVSDEELSEDEYIAE